MKSLPTILKQKYNYFESSKRQQYLAAAVLDLILILIILLTGVSSAERLMTPLISPMVSSLRNSYYSIVHKQTEQSFAFVPGLARNKFDDIDLDGLSYLSFFDVPLTEDGEINTGSKGFSSFSSDEALELFDRARFHKTKILLTLSAWDKDIIINLLNDFAAQDRLADQASEQIKAANIDGITIDFEFSNDENYQSKFTSFISLLTKRIHQSLPDAKVAVAIPSNFSSNQSIYNLENLSQVSDQLFLIASDFIVPEVKEAKSINPIFGYKDGEYWENISQKLGNLFKRNLEKKLVLERAWYGNGDRYPLYIPNIETPKETQRKAVSLSLDESTVELLARGVPLKGRQAAKKYIPLIAKALDDEGILDSNVLAYALATIEHETDETFEPLEEIQGKFSARRRGYEGGMNYFGRGFIQLTHLRNYKAMGQRIGIGDELVKHPELAATSEISAKILAAFFKDNNVANLASQGYFVQARKPINPDYNGRSVARLAMKYEID